MVPILRHKPGPALIAEARPRSSQCTIASMPPLFLLHKIKQNDLFLPHLHRHAPTYLIYSFAIQTRNPPTPSYVSYSTLEITKQFNNALLKNRKVSLTLPNYQRMTRVFFLVRSNSENK